MMVRNIDAQRRVRDYFSFEITGDGKRDKSANENQRRCRIFHFVSFSDAPVRNGN